MITVFRALDDETRRVILDELATWDGRTLAEICSALTTVHGVSSTRQAISQHLGVLEAAGLIVTEKRGRSKFHYFNRAPLAQIARRWPVGDFRALNIAAGRQRTDREQHRAVTERGKRDS